jgi:hypothetical protein
MSIGTVARKGMGIFPWLQVRITLRDQDTTWPAAYDSVRRGYDERGLYYLQDGLQVWSLGCVARLGI